MKAILSKEGGGYDLYRIDEDGKRVTFASTQDYKQKLSLKNCQAIERGYDLDELAWNQLSDGSAPPVGGYESFIRGFRKALEILGDKKFSEEDIKFAFNKGYLMKFNPSAEYQKTLNDLRQSLQQTEWDCIVEMECCGNYSPPCNINCEYGPKPKLDADGCLILKRV